MVLISRCSRPFFTARGGTGTNVDVHRPLRSHQVSSSVAVAVYCSVFCDDAVQLHFCLAECEITTFARQTLAFSVNSACSSTLHLL